MIIGPIRQEILSGYSDPHNYLTIREKLSYFKNTPILDGDYELAAEFCNKCRKKGVQGSHIDFLICAVANRIDIPILTNPLGVFQFGSARSQDWVRSKLRISVWE
jgi:hypothetical protein